jgi:hypothetical protein
MLPIEAIINTAAILVFFAFWMMVFVIFYHLTRFGVGTLPKKLSAIFLSGAVILFCASLLLYVK